MTDRGMEFLGADGALPEGAAASHRARIRSEGKVEGRRGGGADVGAPRRGSGAQIGAERSMFFFEQERKGPQMMSIWAAEDVGLRSTRARLGSWLSSSAGRFGAGAGAAAAAAAAKPNKASAADASGGFGLGAGGRRFSRTTRHKRSGSSLVK